jgi:oligopeptidase A
MVVPMTVAPSVLDPMDGKNPFLKLPFNVPFARLQAEHVVPGIRALMAASAASLDALEADTKAPTYASLLEPLDTLSEALEVAMNVVGHWEAVCTTPPLREAYNTVQPEVSAFWASIPLRPQLWQRLKRYAQAPEAGLTVAQRRFVSKLVDDFRRNGADLPDRQKTRLMELTRELSELTSKFSQNVVAATAAYSLVITDEARLVGLPASARARAREDAAARGQAGFRFTLQGPSLTSALTYLDDGGLRRELYQAFEVRAASGEYSNVELIGRILTLRQEQAKLLGFRNFADFVLADRMAKSGDTARRFVDDLTARSEAAFERECEALFAFRKSLEGPAAPVLEAWDVAYYAEKQRQALYAFDAEELRPYFPLERVVSGLFATAAKLYGVSIEVNPKLEPWHPAVKTYDVRDADGTLLASFYADFFPRDEKRDGAWMNGLVSGTTKPGHDPLHLGLICTNVTPPVGDQPALLSHREVETLFHEFGHLLHLCLSRVDVRHLVGTNVAWDFVELPSQIMENWCWERESLQTFARHYQTGEVLPEALLDKMQRARNYRQATAMMRQLGFAKLDLSLHIDYTPGRDADVLTYARQVARRFSAATLSDAHAMVASFGHLFASPVGYAAGYYSYKWAEVLDADAFTRFKREGIYNPATGNAFRRAILEPGSSRDPLELYREFMQREPALEPLLERSGLLPAPALRAS